MWTKDLWRLWIRENCSERVRGKWINIVIMLYRARTRKHVFYARSKKASKRTRRVAARSAILTIRSTEAERLIRNRTDRPFSLPWDSGWPRCFVAVHLGAIPIFPPFFFVILRKNAPLDEMTPISATRTVKLRRRLVSLSLNVFLRFFIPGYDNYFFNHPMQSTTYSSSTSNSGQKGENYMKNTVPSDYGSTHRK